MSTLSIPGSAGPIEALVAAVDSDRGAVLCHPHPLYGGSMHDGVVAALHDGCRRAGLATLRFNFRGVGASAGAHDHGVAEAEDVATVADWFIENHNLSRVIVGGYSFGAGVAYRAATGTALVLVAPPVPMLEGIPVPDVPVLVLLGSDDQIVNCDAAHVHFADEGRENVQVEVLEGFDHFFMGASERIADCVERFARGT